MGSSDTILQHAALAAALGAATALLLAFAAAAVLVALEELALRQWTNRLTVWTWLACQSRVLRDEAPFGPKLLSYWIARKRSDKPDQPGPPVADDSLEGELEKRLRRLDVLAGGHERKWGKAGKSGKDGLHREMLGVLFDVIGAAMSLPARQLLGVLSATIQADASRRQPSEFVRWMAAIGSLPVAPSPFGEEAEPARATQEAVAAAQVSVAEDKAAGDPVSADTDADAGPTQAEELQMLVQAHADRALDSLQVHLAGGWTVARYGAALLIVWFVSAALTTGLPPYVGWDKLSVNYVWQRFLDFSPNVAIWLAATALVPIVMAPLERLSVRGR